MTRFQRELSAKCVWVKVDPRVVLKINRNSIFTCVLLFSLLTLTRSDYSTFFLGRKTLRVSLKESINPSYWLMEFDVTLAWARRRFFKILAQDHAWKLSPNLPFKTFRKSILSLNAKCSFHGTSELKAFPFFTFTSIKAKLIISQKYKGFFFFFAFLML